MEVFLNFLNYQNDSFAFRTEKQCQKIVERNKPGFQTFFVAKNPQIYESLRTIMQYQGAKKQYSCIPGLPVTPKRKPPAKISFLRLKNNILKI